jgi:putative RNA 2'-phosphotransferase
MNNTHISKFLSLILRHKPEEINLQLDENGWADTDELIKKSNAHGMAIDFDLLEEIVFTNDKKRFSFKDDLSKIRANQGHSVAIDLALTPTAPPEKLYHGTIAKFIDAIKINGLQKMSRQHVHLSKDIDTAKKVGARRGKPIILTINTMAMQQQGYLFYIAENGVWLTDNVPSAFIEF